MNYPQRESKGRLLFVENFLPSFISARLGLARAAAAAGFDVHVAAPLVAAGSPDLDPGLEWHDVAIGRSLSLLDEAKTVARLISLYRWLRPDLVHHVRMKPVVYGGLAARITHVPAVVNTLTGLGYVYHSDSPKARLLRPAVTFGLRLVCGPGSQRLIVQNSDDFNFCVRSKICPPDRIVLIRGSGVDIDHYRPLPEPDDPPLVTLPARMLWDKGVGEFVAAAQLLRASGLRARFALVGSLDPSSPAAVPLETLKRWQASGVVEWWGWQDDIMSVIAQSQVVCLPSYGEGAPRALMEASACGRAIVTTNVSGCRDVVLHGENGLLVPPKDVQGLALALRVLLTQPDVRSRLASNGPQRMADHFSLRRVIANTLDVYRQLLGVEREAFLTSVA